MLTYCTNIHPAESWREVVANVWPRVLQVKGRVMPRDPFPVGLRLSARAAREITQAEAFRFLDRSESEGCFIPTVNGFPYGAFHAGRVKELAYLPDWRSRERVEYTADLIRLLRVWLPGSVAGSISTVPVGFREHVSESDLPLIRDNLLRVLRMLELAAAAGKTIVLALEPEPGCFLETALDVATFVERMDFPRELRPFLGVCYDCCHAAVLFQEPRRDFALLRDAEIPVVKIHVSSAPRITANHLEAARIFDESRYLHQTAIRSGADTVRYPDLCRAVAARPVPGGEWRIHFHLPIFDDGNDGYGTTNAFIGEVLSCRPPDALLEIETYTYQVLPERIRPDCPIDSICREFSWLMSRV